MKLILSSPLEEKTTKRKCSFLGFTQEMEKKPQNFWILIMQVKFISCICSLPTITNPAVHKKPLWTLSLAKSSVPDTLSLVAFSSSTGFFTQLGTSHMLLAIYHPCLKFFCCYRHTVKFSGQVKSVGEQHKPI